MKTTISSVRVTYPSDLHSKKSGIKKTVVIATEDGQLKKHLLKNMLRGGVQVNPIDAEIIVEELRKQVYDLTISSPDDRRILENSRLINLLVIGS